MSYPPHVLNLRDDVRMLDIVRDGLARAQEASIAVSFVRCSGLGLLIEALKEFAARGGRVRVLTSTYLCVTQPDALMALHRMPAQVQTRVQVGSVGFHAKFFWFGFGASSECWVGSSNLTKSGLATNLEWNVRAQDRHVVEAARVQFESLWSRPDVFNLDTGLIGGYRRSYDLSARNAASHDLRASVAQPNAAQREALASLDSLRADGQRRAVVIAATGVGKTHLAAFDFVASGARTCLFVSHRLEHLLQAKRTFEEVTGGAVSLGIVGGGHADGEAAVVFATVQSLASRPDILRRAFDYLVIDEFHHVEAPSYERLRGLADRAFLLGLTATPERADGRNVLSWCNWNIAYEVRLAQAIDRGWLLPFHYFGIADDSLDFARVAWHRSSEVEDALSLEARVDMVWRAALDHGFDGPKRATVGFCAGVRHAQFMAEAFTRRGETSVALSGAVSVEQREATYQRLADPAHPLRWLFVPDILNEGVDIPALNSILFLRPTESATIFLQQLGRGLRLSQGCEVLTVLDFVGHHKSAWLTLNALHMPSGGGRRTELAPGEIVVPPAGCEIVLQRRTREILSKVRRFTTKREACTDAYKRLRSELDRPLMPVDLSGREDVPELRDFREVYGTWLNAQRAHDDAPPWSIGMPDGHAALTFLVALERDWQAPRVTPYALAWGLAESSADSGFAAFFARFPQWRVERSDIAGAWTKLRGKLPPEALDGEALDPAIRGALGHTLLWEVESRLLYTVNKDFRARHTGSLRTPADLHLWSQHQRPEIIRYFGEHYDPARHNTGVTWFGSDCVIITKLNTSGALGQFQYQNRFIDEMTFSWTSQNKQSPDNEAGRRVIEHERRGSRLHLFVQARSHQPANYLGEVRVTEFKGTLPMTVRLALPLPVPADLRRELEPDWVPTFQSSLPSPSNVIPFRTVPVGEARPYANCVPLYANLRIAAGAFGGDAVLEESQEDGEPSSDIQWVELPRPYRPSRDLFLARVEGESMNRVIPNAAYCLWRTWKHDASELPDGTIVLAEQRDILDPEYGGAYTVKRFSVDVVVDAEGLGRTRQIRLSPDSADSAFEPIVVRGSSAAELRIIATFVRVLG